MLFVFLGSGLFDVFLNVFCVNHMFQLKEKIKTEKMVRLTKKRQRGP